MSYYHSADLALLQKMFATVSQELADRYVALHDEASDEYERQCWLSRVIDVRVQRRMVELSDRDALVRCIEEWTSTLNDLHLMGP
ncbi:hypothetical protein A6A08_25790 [Nocardiopsis sp. TSRI0078]|uniref:hypothetical protein n=1 Tax=unclassified Nocardiopsis TaxID=2649073 RepID=UPI00095D4F01|nr:hypothetical protein [Nocardiopsis sp. TSRI0078]OKI17550.1 hypothetical protein A6A08_25790 [Nocardiopsis sp. TSRI0078]